MKQEDIPASDYKPVVAIEFILDNRIIIYYTDRETLVGPREAATTTKTDFKENQMVVNYVSFIDPDNPLSIYHKMLGAKLYDDKSSFEISMKYFIFNYKDIYDEVLNRFPVDKFRPGLEFEGKHNKILWNSVPINKLRDSIYGKLG